ncbi:MAG: hypothetical protein JXL97_02420 [Bacteroidales bacterium]|nr:hypothetical protein [Bacteroidales bacterium]
MLPFPITTFEETYKAYKNYYISRNGSNKFEKAYDTIVNSDKIGNIMRQSKSRFIAPSAKNFLVEIHTIRYFIFAKNETRAMGALIALYYWNETLNKTNQLASDQEMSEKIKSVFGQLSMLY